MEHPNAGSSLRQLLIRGGAWTLAGRLASAVAGLLVNALLARILLPGQLGDYILYASAISLLALFAATGVDASVIALVAGAVASGEPQSARGVLRTGLAWGAVAACIVATLAAAACLIGWPGGAYAELGRHANSLFFAIPWLVSSTLLGIAAGGLRALHRGGAANLLNGPLSAGAMCVVLCGALWIHSGFTIESVVALAALSSTLAAALALFFLLNAARTLGTPDVYPLARLMRDSTPFLVNGMAIFLASQADVWVAGTLLGSQAVATYAAASRLVQVVLMPTLIGNLVIAPFASQLVATKDHARLEKVARALADFTLIPALVAYLAVLLTAPTLLAFVFGSAYRSSAPALIVLCTGQLLNVSAGPAATVLAMTGHQRSVMCLSLAAGALIVTLSVILAPIWGVTGIALAVASATALHGYGSWLLVRRRLAIQTHANGSAICQAYHWIPRWSVKPPH